jgi:hypothetical protein
LVEELPDSSGRRRFVHALVRDGVHADLPAATRGCWHARAAAVLAQRAAERPDLAGEVAFHGLRGAGTQAELAAAVRWSRTAAHEAAAYAPRAVGAPAGGGAAGGAAEPAAAQERAALLVELAARSTARGPPRRALTTAARQQTSPRPFHDRTCSRPRRWSCAASGTRATAALLFDLCERSLRSGPHPAGDRRQAPRPAGAGRR